MASAATASLLPKLQQLTSSYFTTNPSSSPLSLHYPSSLSSSSSSSLPTSPSLEPPIKKSTAIQAKKKNPWLDPFDDGEDRRAEYGEYYVDGKQEEDPRPPDDPNSPYGFLKFPPGYSVEVASLPLKIRGDVRRCCCIISGGVYENLLFFPAIQLIKDRYPGVQIDVVTTDRGKQCYEMNKNVRWADVYDPDDYFPEPAEYMDMIGVLKNRYYDLVLSTKLAGFGHGAFLFMTSARDRVSYVYPNVNAAGAGLFLSETFTPATANLSEAGYNMYQEMGEWLGRPARNVPRHPIPPLKVSLSRKLKAFVEAKYKTAGVDKGKYIVIHGIKSDSLASMHSRGDTDSLLPIEVWDKIIAGESIRGFKPLFVIPHEKVREDFEEVVEEDANIVLITTPGQLAALINDSAGVIATNTAAIQMAHAREKPCIALFCSEEKGRLFAPYASAETKWTTISSKTGKLIDIDVQAVRNALGIFEATPATASALV